MASHPLVLITGSNGFVGYAVLAGTLKAGCHVRAVVRRQEAVDQISRGPSVQPYLSSGALSFALVPDNTKPGAYDEAAAGCAYIIHVASPLPLQPGNLVAQAVAGTKTILEAAEATPSVKRVVFTSSTASLRPFERLLAGHPANRAIMSGDEDEVATMTADTRVPTQDPTSDDAPALKRYTDSKIAAVNFTDAFNASQFSIVNLMPGWILGPEELTRNKKEAFKGSNMILSWLFNSEFRLNPFYGLPAEENLPLPAETVHLDDVVECHVKALDSDKVPGKYRNFLLLSDGPKGPVFGNAADVVRKELPGEVADGKIPFAGKLDTIPMKFDAAPTERELLGHPFRPYEQQVKDTIKWYVHLPDGEV